MVNTNTESGSDPVSVIIPTYYRNERLRTAIRSVCDQRYDPIEIIVVDDSGERHAEDTAKSMRNKINHELKYAHHDSNCGAHAARDTGLQHATGAYIQFLDDDDRLDPKKLFKQVQLIETKEDTGVAYCGVEFENGRQHFPDENVRGDVLSEALRFTGVPVMTSALLIKHDMLKKISPLHRSSLGADDVRMTIELAQHTRFDFIDEILVIAGDTDESRGVSKGMVREHWNILDQYEGLYSKQPQEVYDSALSRTYQRQARWYLDNNIWSPTAIYSFGKAIQHAPEYTPFLLGEFITSFGGRIARNRVFDLIRYLR